MSGVNIESLYLHLFVPFNAFMIIFNLQESQRSCSKDILTYKQNFAPERWSSLVATALDCSMSEATVHPEKLDKNKQNKTWV